MSLEVYIKCIFHLSDFYVIMFYNFMSLLTWYCLCSHIIMHVQVAYYRILPVIKSGVPYLVMVVDHDPVKLRARFLTEKNAAAFFNVTDPHLHKLVKRDLLQQLVTQRVGPSGSFKLPVRHKELCHGLPRSVVSYALVCLSFCLTLLILC